MNKMVLGFVFNKDLTDVLLIEKNRPEWQKGKINGIGGHIEHEEEPIDAMSREFFEETGIVISANGWKEVGTIGGDKWLCYIFTAKIDDLFSYIDKTDEKCIIHKMREHELHSISVPFNCISNLAWIIPMCVCSYNDSFHSTTNYFDVV